jgi:hypothetical protein
MKSIVKMMMVALCVVILLAMPLGAVVADDSTPKKESTIVGTINDNFQIVTDNDVKYDIDISDQGDELAGHVGERVQVTGVVEETDDVKSIMVISFKVLEKKEKSE